MLGRPGEFSRAGEGMVLVFGGERTFLGARYLILGLMGGRGMGGLVPPGEGPLMRGSREAAIVEEC